MNIMTLSICQSGRVGNGIYSGAVFLELNGKLHSVAGAGGLFANCKHAAEARTFASAHCEQLNEPPESLNLWYDPEPTPSQFLS